jgi:hypothetical protein
MFWPLQARITKIHHRNDSIFSEQLAMEEVSAKYKVFYMPGSRASIHHAFEAG